MLNLLVMNKKTIVSYLLYAFCTFCFVWTLYILLFKVS